jgi:hypothetical protein
LFRSFYSSFSGLFTSILQIPKDICIDARYLSGNDGDVLDQAGTENLILWLSHAQPTKKVTSSTVRSRAVKMRRSCVMCIEEIVSKLVERMKEENSTATNLYCSVSSTDGGRAGGVVSSEGL